MPLEEGEIKTILRRLAMSETPCKAFRRAACKGDSMAFWESDNSQTSFVPVLSSAGFDRGTVPCLPKKKISTNGLGRNTLHETQTLNSFS